MHSHLVPYFAAASFSALGSAASAAVLNPDAVFPTAAEVIAATPAQATVGQAFPVSGSPSLSLTQTFQVTTAFQLDSIFIKYNNSAAGRTGNLVIYPVSDVNATTISAPTSQTALLSTPFTMPTGSLTTGTATSQILEFDLQGAEQITLPATTGTAGYGVRFVQSGASAPFSWFRTGSNVYPEGRAFGGNNAFFASEGGRDFSLAIVAVPEPTSAAAVLGMGMLALARRRRDA